MGSGGTVCRAVLTGVGWGECDGVIDGGGHGGIHVLRRIMMCREAWSSSRHTLKKASARSPAFCALHVASAQKDMQGHDDAKKENLFIRQ